MSRPATISGIVPVWNGERFLAEALESMLAQTRPPLEIIVVDDGSTDRSPDIAGTFADRIRYVRQPNQGPPSARNAGIALARGDLIAFLDADDIWHPDKTARQAARFDARPELDYCVTGIQNIWMPEVDAERVRFLNHPRGRSVPGYVSQTLMVRRSAFARLGTFDPAVKHADSADWFLRARRAGAISEYLEDVLTFRRMHLTNRSRERAPASIDEFLRLVWRAKHDPRNQKPSA